MIRLLVFIILGNLVLCAHGLAAPKQVRVFVALCDNRTQGIIPVGERIGNGDDPESNLYWGCSDGFGAFFRDSKRWKRLESRGGLSETVLRRVRFRHVDGDVEITTEAYRGSQIRQCLVDFEKAAGSGRYNLVAFIGHNGLMDFELPRTEGVPGNKTAVVVLCCRSEAYFGERLRALGCRPVLMTQQLMYPGSFLLDAAIGVWRKDGGLAEIRAAAGSAYARNQGISVRAATRVFAPLAE